MSILRNATAVQVPALSAEPKVMGSKREEETHTAPCHQCLTARDTHGGEESQTGAERGAGRAAQGIGKGDRNASQVTRTDWSVKKAATSREETRCQKMPEHH